MASLKAAFQKHYITHSAEPLLSNTTKHIVSKERQLVSSIPGYSGTG